MFVLLVIRISSNAMFIINGDSMCILFIKDL